MTIQIFELTIKMVVEDKHKKQHLNINNITSDELVAECVEQTLRRLEQLKER